jgi:hypothetical protein
VLPNNDQEYTIATYLDYIDAKLPLTESLNETEKQEKIAERA